MMKRRIILMGCTLGVLLLAFIVYYLVTKGDVPDQRSFDYPDAPGGGRPARDMFPEKVGSTTFRQFDEQHRLRAVYKWKVLDKRGEQYHMTEPNVQWYLRTGEVVTITADRGVIRVNPVGDRWNPREGRLNGHVKIVVDRRVEPTDIPADQRPGDTIRIHTDRVHFDRDSLTIKTPANQQISVFAGEADMVGKGLHLSWNESPQELRELRITEGEWMCIREGQDRFMSDVSLSGQASPSPVATEKATTKPGAKAVKPDRPKEPTGPVAPGGQPAVVKDTYRVVFHGEVEVVSGDSKRAMRGADKLELIFEFGDPREDAGEESVSAETEGVPTPAKSPTTAPATRPTAPKPPKPVPPARQLIITWTGPLVIKPLRAPAKYVEGRFDVIAHGENVYLQDRDVEVTCHGLELYTRMEDGERVRTGELTGDREHPVHLEMASGETLVAPIVLLDKDGLAHLDGAGEMHLAGGGASVLSAVGEETDGGEDVILTWADRVDVEVGRQDTDDGGRDYLRSATFIGDVNVAQGPTQTMKARQLTVAFEPPLTASDPVNRVKSMQALGNVEMRDSATGEFVKADQLDVDMATVEETKTDAAGVVTKSVRIYPRQAVAIGNVSAAQWNTPDEGEEPKLSTLTGEKLTIEFARETRPGEESPVVVVKSASLIGVKKPAKVAQSQGGQRENELIGHNITFERELLSAEVTGKGQLRFWTDSDLSGNRSAKPRLVEASWRDRLHYRGTENIADLLGDVRLVVAGDRLSCDDRMRVYFEEVEEEDEVAGDEPQAADAASQPTTRPAGLFAAGAGINPRDVAMVVADKNVKLESLRLDADGYLERRLELSADKMVYHAAAGTFSCPGPGTLFVEDYRLPAKKKPGDSSTSAVPGGVSRPSQSAFEWSKSMTLDRPRPGEEGQGDQETKTTASMVGDVRMSHRSGRQLVLLKKLNVRPWKTSQLPKGRKTTLVCERMLAQFGPAEATDKAQPDAEDTGPRVGALELFNAYRDVSLTEATRRIECQRILYQADASGGGVGLIWGSLPDQPVKNAVVYEEDRLLRRLVKTKAGRKLIWRRKFDARTGRETDRIEAAGIEGGGGR